MPVRWGSHRHFFAFLQLFWRVLFLKSASLYGSPICLLQTSIFGEKMMVSPDFSFVPGNSKIIVERPRRLFKQFRDSMPQSETPDTL